MRFRLSFIFLFILVSLISVIFYKSLFEVKNYIPKNVNNKIENISIKEFNTDNNIILKNLFEEEKLIVINIWASWCIPCREEHPYLVKLKKDSLIKIIGINYKDKKNNALKFLDDFENPYAKIFNDKNGTVSIEIGAYGVPESFILNKKKEIIKKIIGPIDKKEFNEILKLLKDEN